MKSTTIIQRLTLLVALPLLALTISAGMQIRQAFVDYQNSSRTLQLMDLSVSTGNLIHALQIERGATAGFLQSKGQKFADVLPAMRSRTDDGLAAFAKQFEAIDANTLPALAKAVAETRVRLAELGTLRQRATQLELTVPEEVGYYTGTIANLIGTMSVGVDFNHDASISQKLIAYLSFVRAKENAGQERALTTAAFAANRVEPAQYRSILSKVHHQEAYFDDFFGIAGAAEKTSLQSVLAGASATEVARLRTVLMDKAGEGGFAIDPTEWFKTITAKIDGLHDTENLITGRIGDDAKAQLQASRSSLLSLGIAGGVALILTVLVSFAIARNICVPLREMVDFVETSIAGNDFSGQVPEHGATEVARTGAAFNLLVGKFRSIIVDAKQSSEKITSAAHSLALASKKVGESSLVQSGAAESVAAAVEQASVSVSETANNARAAADVVVRAREDSERALTVMRDTVSNVTGIAQLIGESSRNVEHLAESSQKIGNIVQVIKDIADQTNLLALNAAIEAARAGDQGRGFAVVADEVRKLAERTAKATGEIATLIEAIQDGIGGTVSAMQQANAQAGTSLELVDRTEQALHQIDDGSGAVASNVQSISHALAEQDAAIRQIAVNVEQIAQMTENNNNAASANNQTAAELDSLSLQLRNSVAVFKV